MKYSIIIVILIVFRSDSFRVRPNGPKIWLSGYMESDGFDLASVAEFQNVDVYENDFLRKNGTEYVLLSTTRQADFTCEADYPITWTLPNPEQFSGITYPILRTTTERISRFDTSMADPETPKFYAHLQISNHESLRAQESGYLACQNVNDPKVQSTIYVYAEGQSPMEHVGEDIQINVTSPSTTVIIPCRPTLPEISISLLKRFVDRYDRFKNVTTYTWRQLDSSDSVRFDPRVGFELVKWPPRSINGKYKCVVDGEETDMFTNIEVTKLNISTESAYDFIPRQSITSKRSKLTIGPSNVKCCVKNSETPVTGDTFECSNAAECDLLKPVFMYDVLTGKRMQRPTIRPYNHGVGVGSPTRNQECFQTYLDTHYIFVSSRLFICDGPGIDVVAQFVAGYQDDNSTIGVRVVPPRRYYMGHQYPQTGKIFDLSQNNMTIGNKIRFEISVPLYTPQHSTWLNSDYNNYYGYGLNYGLPYNDYSASYRRLRRRRPLYAQEYRYNLFEGEPLLVTCRAHPFFHASGGWLRLNWKNGSRTVFRQVNTSDFFELGEIGAEIDPFRFTESYLQLRASSSVRARISDSSIAGGISQVKLEMQSLDCIVPVWNSHEWDVRTYKMNVKVAELPEIEDAKIVESVVVKLNQSDFQINCTLKETNQSRLLMPSVYWAKDGKPLKTYHNGIGLMSSNYYFGNSTVYTLTLQTATHATQGDYQCVAENVGGKVVKVYKVFVDDGKGGSGGFMVIFGIACVSLLVSVVGALVWRHWHLRKSILQLLSR